LLVFSIDPGVSGAICVFKNKDILEIYDVPTMVDGKKNKRQINSAQVTHIFKVFYMKAIKFR
jgi:crossover junction endodeoxyribonuclease RuvC